VKDKREKDKEKKAYEKPIALEVCSTGLKEVTAETAKTDVVIAEVGM